MGADDDQSLNLHSLQPSHLYLEQIHTGVWCTCTSGYDCKGSEAIEICSIEDGTENETTFISVSSRTEFKQVLTLLSLHIIGASLSEPHINGTAVRKFYIIIYYYYGTSVTRNYIPSDALRT